MASAPDPRLHLLGIRHHGPGSAALLVHALDAIDPACVLVEGPPEGDALIPYVAEPGMVPPLAMLLHAADDPDKAFFMPFAEFSPEWQAMRWALAKGRPVRFFDWPAAVSLAYRGKREEKVVEARPDALDMLAEAAGYKDGEAFWNGLIEQSGASGQKALAVFAAIETAMTEARAHEGEFAARDEDVLREAWMRTGIRQALKEHEGPVAVVTGAWHLGALRAQVKAADDKAVMQTTVKDLPKVKVEATWVPWTDSRLSARSGYGAGVISPGWYRHLWGLYQRREQSSPEEFAAVWQARTAHTLRAEGYGAPVASAIESARLALSLAALRGVSMPGLPEMREAALATFCHGNPVPLALIEQKLYIGERVGEIDERVPQMPLARDLAVWQKKTRLKPEDLELEMKLDLRSEAGLLKSTLLHRLALLGVTWGKLVESGSARGTFREVWTLRWVPELSVRLAEALIYGVTIEQASANAAREKAKGTTSVTTLAEIIQGALIADLPDAASDVIAQMQAAAVNASDITDLMKAVAPLVRVLRYGSARKLPAEALRELIRSLAVEVNAGVRVGSRNLDDETTRTRVEAMEIFDEALTLFSDEALTTGWRGELALMVDDDAVVAPVAGVALRRLHDTGTWKPEPVAAAFSRHTGGRDPKHAGQFMEGFLRGGSEVILHDAPLLHLIDAWLCGLKEEDFVESLPLLRRSLAGFDATGRRRLFEVLGKAPVQAVTEALETEDNAAFAAAIPLLLKILGVGGAA